MLGTVKTAFALTAAACVAYGVEPSNGMLPPSDQHSQELPKIIDFVDQARGSLRLFSQAETADRQIEATLDLVRLSERIGVDPRYPSHPILKRLRAYLRTKLRAVKNDLLAEERRHRRRPKTIKVDRTVLAQLNRAVNGPGAANANVAAQDYGPLLIELIQRTISPQSWDVAGGASTIRYWRPGMALVVRAPQGLHEQLGPLLGQLRSQ